MRPQEIQAEQAPPVAEPTLPATEERPQNAGRRPPLPEPPYGVPSALLRRRQAAARVRRRRLLVADLGVGLLLALVGLVLAPGLAILAIAAILALVACAGWLVIERRRRRRRSGANRGPTGAGRA